MIMIQLFFVFLSTFLFIHLTPTPSPFLSSFVLFPSSHFYLKIFLFEEINSFYKNYKT